MLTALSSFENEKIVKRDKKNIFKKIARTSITTSSVHMHLFNKHVSMILNLFHTNHLLLFLIFFFSKNMRSQNSADQANKEEMLRKQQEEIFNRINEEKIIIENIGEILESISNTDVKQNVFEQAASTFTTVFQANIRQMDNIFTYPEPPSWLEPLVNDERWHGIILKLAPENQDSMLLKYLLREIYQRYPQKIHSLPCGCTPLSDFLKILPNFADPLKRGEPSALEKFVDLIKSDDAILTATASAIHKSRNIPFILRVWEQLGRQKQTRESKIYMTYILRVENCVSTLIKYILNDVNSDFERLDFIKQCKLNYTPDKSNYSDENSPPLSQLLSLPENSNKKLTTFFVLQKIPKLTLFGPEIAKLIYKNSLKSGEQPKDEVLVAIDKVIGPAFKQIFANETHINRYYLFQLAKERFFAVSCLDWIEWVASKDENHGKGFYENVNQILFEINYWYQDLRLKIVYIIQRFLQHPGKDPIFYQKFLGVAFYLMTSGYPLEILRAITFIGKGSNAIHIRSFFQRIVNNYKPKYSIPFLEGLLTALTSPPIFPVVFPANPKETMDPQKKTLLVALKGLFEQIIHEQRQELEDLARQRVNQPNPLAALIDLIGKIDEGLSRSK